MVIAAKMQTIDTAKTTEIGLSSHVSILVTVGRRAVVNSPETVDGSGSVAGVDIVIRELPSRAFSHGFGSSGKIPLVNTPFVERHGASSQGVGNFARLELVVRLVFPLHRAILCPVGVETF